MNSEDLWWKVSGECRVAETEYSPRHLISTVDSPLTFIGMVLMAHLTWFDLILQISAQMSPPPSGHPRLLTVSLHPPAQLFYIASS